MTAAWLSAVALRERVTLAESSLATARNLLTFIESRARAGSASPLELAQQRGLTAGREDALAELKAERARSELALGLLLGRAGSVSVRASTLDSVKLPSWRAGIPSELLTRRPDIARAEADLAAAEADVDAARAALLPRLTFRVGVDASGSGSASFFSRPFHELASGLSAPVFQGGRLRAEADEIRARRQELLANYHKTIATAFSDVERALVALHETETRRAPQETGLAEARRALDLSDSRYRAGAETLLTLLNAQESLNEAQAAHTAWRLAQFQAALSLVSALGGGWEK